MNQLPILKDLLNYEIRLEHFLEIVYSYETAQQKDFYNAVRATPLARWDFECMAHAAHYFQCEKLEKELQSIVEAWNFPTHKALWHFLLLAETYNWPAQLREKLIQMVGENLEALRERDEPIKAKYNYIWPQLSRKTCEEILEVHIKQLKRKVKQ